MSLSKQAKSELQWWCDNVLTPCNVISHVEPQHQVTTDASSKRGELNKQCSDTEELDSCGSPAPHKLIGNGLTQICVKV